MNDRIFQPCAAWVEKLAATHSDDLSPTERTELEDHVVQCTACRAVQAEYRLMDERIHSYWACEPLLSPPFPIPVPDQHVNNEVGLPLPTLDRVYRRGLHNRPSWYGSFLSAYGLVRRISVAILILIACFLASLLLSMYLLKIGALGL